MKLLLLASMLLSVPVFAAENTAIQTDIKLLCAINKMERTFSKDKNADQADLAVRFYNMKQAALQQKASKDALKATAAMDTKEQIQAWKEFSKQNNIDGSCL
jgi:hypothetical protein